MALIRWDTVAQLRGEGAKLAGEGAQNIAQSIGGVSKTLRDNATRLEGEAKTKVNNNIRDRIAGIKTVDAYDEAVSNGLLTQSGLNERYGEGNYDYDTVQSFGTNKRPELLAKDRRNDNEDMNRLMTRLSNERNLNKPNQRDELDQFTAFANERNLSPEDRMAGEQSLRMQQQQANKFTDSEERDYQARVGEMQTAAKVELGNAQVDLQLLKDNNPIDDKLTTKQEEMTVESVINDNFRTKDGKDSSYKMDYLDEAKKGYKGPDGKKIPVPGYVLDRVMQGLSFEGKTGAFFAGDRRIDANNYDLLTQPSVDVMRTAIDAAMKQHLGFEANSLKVAQGQKDYNAFESMVNEKLLKDSAKNQYNRNTQR